MPNLNRLSLFLMGCLLFSTVPTIAEDVMSENIPARDGYQQLASELESVIQQELRNKDVPAFSIALIDGDHVVWAQGFGFEDPEQTRPATAGTVYRVGSVSKLFTDFAVMQLVEQGKLDLEAPVTDVLPDFQPENPWEIPITLRQLMSHRSGLVRESPVGHYFDPTEPTLAATVQSLNQTRLVYEPKTRTKYSNAGIAVVGRALEAASGNDFHQQMQTALLQPLGMDHSSFEFTPELEKHFATGWMWTYDGRRFEAPNFALGTTPAGNLYSTVLDLSKFVQCIFHDGKSGTQQLLQPETLQLMKTPSIDKRGFPEPYAIGFSFSYFDLHRQISHGGAVYGFATQLQILPKEKLAVAAVSTLDASNGFVEHLTDHALRLLLARQAGKELPTLPVSSPIPKELVRSMAGKYVSGDESFVLSNDNGRLTIDQGTFLCEVRALADQFVIDGLVGHGARIERRNADVLVMDGREYRREEVSLPPPPPEHWNGLIGEYGWDHNTLYILEKDGQLHALIEWFFDYPLEELGPDEYAFPDYGLYHGEKLKFERDEHGRATHVVAAEVDFLRREVGTKDGETFQITPVKPIDDLRDGALAASPPEEKGTFNDTDFVQLTDLEPGIKLDIRYATTNNFTGSVFYKQPRAFMQRPAAEAVAAAHRRLKEHGVGLLIHDAYRPWYVTKMFWDATPDDMKQFVANPANGSRHNRGCAVDLTLYDLETGEPIQTVAGYDEFSTRSYPDYPGGTSRQRWYRELLRRTMEESGFTVYEYEWWHFDYKDWRRYRIHNLTFEEILAGQNQDEAGSAR